MPRRAVCPRCRRPLSVCYCAELAPQATRTRVVFLQHPREAKVAIGTAWMTHLMLENSELHQGVQFAGHPRVAELVADPAAALLFPGPGARDPTQLGLGEVRTLVVIDGTWAQARKVYKENPILHQLPRIGLVPETPGQYRIRREPAADCLATIEAVVLALGALEREPARFAQMLAAFTFMVDQQIARAAARSGPPRRWKWRAAQVAAERSLREKLGRAVVIHAEVNAHARARNIAGRPELLHLCAERLATGERFESILAPRRPLAESAAFHLGLPAARLLAGESVVAAEARWRSFFRASDIACGWGHYSADALAAEWGHHSDWLDLRQLVARRLQGSPGSPAQAAARLGAPEPPRVSSGRAGAMAGQLTSIATLLAAELAAAAAELAAEK